MSCGVQYPQEPPVECIKALVSAYRDGTLFEDRACTAHHVWNIQGYAQRMAFGDPHDDHPPVYGTAPPAPPAPPAELTDEQAVAYLEQFAEADQQTYAALPIPWLSIAAWVAKLIFERLNK